MEEAVINGEAAERDISTDVSLDVNGHAETKASEKAVVSAKVDGAVHTNRRVFLTHGKNKSLLGTLKELLAFGEFEAVVSVEHETVSQPVPDKVMEDMRRCSAAIIHVDPETKIQGEEGNSHGILNPNVLIEIGAAMALYGRRFILLVRDGVLLPSNLQGLYEVRYQGDRLDSDATIKLLKAISDIKNHPRPKLDGSN
jgi:predicted nucleotide-binding protein